MEVGEVLDDCRSEQVRALIEEHNRGAEFMSRVRSLLEEVGIKGLPPAPRKIIVKRRK